MQPLEQLSIGIKSESFQKKFTKKYLHLMDIKKSLPGKEIALIYKITSPTKRVYIGSTVNIKQRINCYKKLRCEAQPRIYHSLLKYGVERHKIEIIAECDEKDRYIFEIYYIRLYSSLGKNGLNSSIPGSINNRLVKKNKLVSIVNGDLQLIDTNFKNNRLFKLNKKQVERCKYYLYDLKMKPKDVLYISGYIYFMRKAQDMYKNLNFNL